MGNAAATALIAAGVACLAACIGALTNLTTFVGGRDLKISEFRQGWVNTLRDSVVSFCAASRISAAELAAAGANSSSLPSLMSELLETREKLADSYHKAVLLLNLNEMEHRRLKGAMQQVQTGLKHFVSFADIQVKLDLVEQCAAEVIKKEWTVIKQGGETSRRLMSRAEIFVFTFLGIGICSLVIGVSKAFG